MLESTFPQFKKTVKLFTEYQSYLSTYPHKFEELDFYGIGELLEHPNGKYWDYMLSEAFTEEYLKLSHDEEYFLGCTSEIYRNSYSYRLKQYLKENVDSIEIDFIVKEYKSIMNFPHLDFIPDRISTNIKLSIKRVKEYLIDKALECQYKIIWTENSNGGYNYDYINLYIPNENEVSAIDLTDETGASKIIYLIELGIIDYLKSKSKSGFSINQIATVLSAITGEKASSLQSMLNPIGNQSVSQRNNPFNNETNVSKVRLKIKNIGF